MGEILNSKNVVAGGFRNIKGNIHIGDIYYTDTPKKDARDFYQDLSEISSTIGIPQEPFIGLKWFTRKHARIFFGRGRLIKQLSDLLKNEHGDKLILLYGQSGVGKSSFLNAGLIPRIETEWDTVYHRESINSTTSQFIQNELYPELARKRNKKTLVVLDQIEEIFTFHSLDLFDQFEKAVSLIKKINLEYPHVKFILSFRKEYLSEIELLFTNNEFNYTKIFVEPLSKEGIIEAITGVAHGETLNSKYHLTIDSALPEVIANEILKDKSSHIAPTLQILMTKLWSTAVEFNPASPKISMNLYKTHVENNGIYLTEFLNEQFEILRTKNNLWVDSGLTIDVLKNFVTRQETAASCNRKEILSLYSHIKDIDTLLTSLKDLYLITEELNSINNDRLRLGHDSLGSLINEKYHSSPCFGQKARIILENRIQNTEKDPDENLIYSPLDETDLDIVEKGEKGMRVFTTQEQELVKLSAIKRANAKKRRRVVLAIFGITICVIISLGVIAFIQYGKTQKAYQEVQKSNYQIEKAYDENKSLDLTFYAKEVALTNPTQAIRLLEAANSISPANKTILQNAYDVYLNSLRYPFYSSEIETNFFGSDVVLSPDEKYIIEFEGASTRSKKKGLIQGIDGEILGEIQYNNKDIESFLFFPKSKKIACLFDNYSLDEIFEEEISSIILITDYNGKHLDTLLSKGTIEGMTISPNEEFLITGEIADNETLEGQGILQVRRLTDFKIHQSYEFSAGGIDYFDWHPKGKKVLFNTYDSIVVLDLDSQTKFTKPCKGCYAPIFSPKGNYFATGSTTEERGIAWDLQGNEVASMPHSSYVWSVSFSPDEKQMASSSWDETIKIWAIDGTLINTINNGVRTWFSYFTSDSKNILSVSRDNGARLWTVEGELISIMENRTPLINAQFFKKTDRIMTATKNGIKLWNTTPTFKVLNEGRWAFYGKDNLIHFNRNSLVITNNEGVNSFTHKFELNIKALRTVDSGFVVTTGTSHRRSMGNTGIGDTSHVYIFLDEKLEHVFTAYEYSITGLEIDENNQSILTVCSDGKSRLVNFSGDVIRTFLTYIPHREEEGGIDKITSAKFSPSKDTVMVATSTGFVILYNKKGELLTQYSLGMRDDKKPTATSWSGGTKTAVFSSDGRKIGVFLGESFFLIHDIETAITDTIVYSKNGGIHSLIHRGSFLGNGKTILAQSNYGVTIWDVESKKLIAKINFGDHYFDLAKNGKHLLLNRESDESVLLSTPQGIFNWIKNSQIAPPSISTKELFE
jgi:WD40 repeat protein